MFQTMDSLAFLLILEIWSIRSPVFEIVSNQSYGVAYVLSACIYQSEVDAGTAVLNDLLAVPKKYRMQPHLQY